MPLTLSIITINLNNLNGLIKTIESVQGQSYSDYEHIVVDGLSDDGSVEFLRNHSDYFSYFVSEEDNGIYDAMNKGVIQAKGKWIYFLNAGDIFHDKEVLANIFKRKKINKKDVIYGSTVKIEDNKQNHIKPSELSSFFYKLPFSHQAVFVKTELLKQSPFDTKYRIASDYDLLCRLYNEKRKFLKINIPLAIMAGGGISSTNTDEMYLEYEQISSYRFKGFKRKCMYMNYRMHVAYRKLQQIFGILKN